MADAGFKLTVEGEREFRKAISDINAILRLNQAELQKVTAEYNAGEKSIDSMKAKQTELGSVIERQTAVVAQMEDELSRLTDTYGENDKGTIKMRTELDKASASLASMQAQFRANAEEIEKAAKATENYDNTIADADAQIKAFAAELRAMETAVTDGGESLSLFGKNSEETKKQIKSLTDQNELLEKSVEQHRKKLDLLNAEMEEAVKLYGSQSREVASYRTEIATTQAEVQELTKKIDANNDGEISASEAERVVDIYLNHTGIQSLDDLKHFPNLLHFSCHNEALSTIELSQNTKLIWLDCAGNQITNINLTNLTALQYLQVPVAPSLTSLDVSKNIALVHFEVGRTELTTLDLWHNVALEKIYCWDNKLTRLNLNEKMPLKVLNCRNNQLSSLNVSNFTKLEYLDCQTNKLSYLDVTKNVELTNLNCRSNQLMTLDISKNTKLTRLLCDYNQLTSLDVSNNLELSSLWCINQDDEQGNNLLETIYIAQGQEIEDILIPEETVIEEKE